MENDYKKGINIIENKQQNKLESVFKLDYNNQQLFKNNEFQKWKNLMILKYGKNAKLFKCEKHKILFYNSNDGYINSPLYVKMCPICNELVCCFCSLSLQSFDASYNKGSCCLRRRIYYLFFNDGLRFIKQEIELDSKCYYIPLVNFFLFILSIHSSLFYHLCNKNTLLNTDYQTNLQNNSELLYAIIFIINQLFSILLIFPYAIANIYFTIFMLLISIPFKYYPIKYFAGITYEGMNYE